jgi:hypothetical protein
MVGAIGGRVAGGGELVAGGRTIGLGEGGVVEGGDRGMGSGDGAVPVDGEFVAPLVDGVAGGLLGNGMVMSACGAVGPEAGSIPLPVSPNSPSAEGAISTGAWNPGVVP